ncbi:MAG: type III-B CRISPR module RAMP protein Cmr4 [Thermoproteota archaeon]|nr:MAG: type III-B CRISPR module RAMP protein Cmr4 [Candidatus Korarchaeota archaeon]
MYGKTLIMYIYALTPLHPGSGVSLSGLVDQPIQRERHTNFPIIQGSSLKGVLRSYAKLAGRLSDDELKTLFGKEDHVGGIAVSDARILAFPVRSLRGVFTWITCPMVLDRYMSDLGLANDSVGWNLNKLKPSEESAIVNKGSNLVVDGNILLEDIMLNAEPKDLSLVVDHLAERGIPKRSYLQDLFKKNLVIVSDGLFAEFVELTTEIVARVKLKNDGTKTVENLWYEEYIPSDTLMYSMIMLPQREDTAEIEELLRKVIPAEERTILNIGGDETVGKGFAEVKLYGKTDQT